LIATQKPEVVIAHLHTPVGPALRSLSAVPATTIKAVARVKATTANVAIGRITIIAIVTIAVTTAQCK
jgi:hypothetical protein